jgi:hypothetical protein
MPAIVDCVVTGNTVGVHAKLSSGASFRGGTIAGNREAQVRVDPCPGTPSAAQARFVPGETGLHFADTTLASGGSPGPLLDLPLLDLFLRGWRSTGVRLDHPKPAEAIRVGGIPVSIETWSAWLAEEPAGKPGGAEAAVPDAGDPPDEAVGDGGGIPVEAPRNWVRLAKDLRARQAEAWTANPYAAAAGAAAERFHPVDLAPFVTRACSGEEGFVGAGLPLGPGPLKMHGVPFVMVGDEATPPMAYGVALESPNFPSAVRALPAEVRIPVGRRAARLYALHVLAYAHGGGRAATCRLEYADGTGAEWPVVSPGNRPGFESEAVLAQATAGANVQDWWPSFPAFSNAGARAAPVVDARPYEAGAIEPPPPVAIRRGALAYRAGTVMGMCVYTAEWRLPHPEKEIAALVFEREPDSPQAYMLLGLTLLADAVPPK